MPDRLAPAIRGLLGAFAVFAVCEVLTRAEFVSREFVPYASDVARHVPPLLVDGEFLNNVGATLDAFVIALVLAILVAVPVGVLFGSSAVAYRIARMLTELLRPIPSVTLIPLLILMVGPGLEMKVFVGTYAAVWPILFNTVYAIHDVDPVAKDTARSFGLSRFELLWRVSLPSAAPMIATGVRISAGVVLTVVISAELITAGSPGMGTFIKLSSAGIGQAPVTFAAAIVAGLLGFLINALFQTFERRAFAWSSREGRS